jgi:uncharacterized protein (DUF1330 family)
MAKAYWIAMIDVTNPEKFKDYVENGPKTLTQYGGRFLARNGKLEVFEGTAAKRIALIEFPNLERAEAFYRSAEYQNAKLLREDAATCTFMAVEGLE